MNSTMVSELGLERSSSLPTLMPLLQRIRLRLRAIGKRIAHKALPFCLTSSTWFSPLRRWVHNGEWLNVDSGVDSLRLREARGLPSSPTSGPGPKPPTAIPEIEVVNLDDESDDSEGQVAPPHAGIEVITLADDSDEVGTLDGNSQNSQSPPRRQRPVPAQRAIFGEESPSRSPSPRRVALAVGRTGSAMSGILHNGSRSSSVVSGSRRGSVMGDVDYYGIFPGSSLFYTGTTPSPTRDEHQHVELVDEDVLGPDDPIPTPPLEGCTDLKNIVHFYRVRVTEFSTRGGGGGAIRSA
ncbi:hypothetical protein D6C78_02699 [Aureobasidium pullulans]|uniref:Uncharacterized protein n=1 Tax=Aureobasidium pullulans TaxID=5580 RepID=A0A4T0C0H0_AURPU|nr:hypothetical protein D6C78_02699 [Aureobasidium pullulans]